MKVSFLILNFNCFKLTNSLIESIKYYDLIDNIIVVDNNSSDNSKEELRKINNNKVKFIFNNENFGYSKGNNIGLKYAVDILKSDYIIVSNPDIMVNEEALLKCIQAFDINDKYAIVAPTINNINSKGDIAWKIPNYYNDIFSLFYITNKLFNKNLLYKNSVFQKKFTEVEVLPGSLLVMKGSLMKEIGYFDENVFLYCEERILASKLKEKGYKSVLLNDYNYIHEHGSVIKKQLNSKIKQYKILNSSKRYFLVNYGNIGRVKIKIFDFMVRISLIEKYLIDKFKNFSIKEKSN